MHVTYPTTRVLALLEILQSQRTMTGVELARRLEVDTRTIRRYATRLADIGIPVEAERGRYGGYRLRPGYRLPPLMLTDDEATAVVLGLLAGRQLGMATATPAIHSALAKLYRVLPDALREQTSAIEESLAFTLPARGAESSPAVTTLLALASAVSRRRRVRFQYRSWRGEDTERELDPYGLVFHSGRWYTTGHDHRRNETRTFRVDRVAAVELLGDEFAAPEDFDAATQVTTSLANVPYAHEIEIVLETSMSEARRRLTRTVGTLSEVEGGVLLRARAERLDGAARMLAGLEWPFEIRSPDALREALAAHASDLAKRSQPLR